MQRDGRDAATAFETLRRTSMKSNCKLRDVAQRTVEEADTNSSR